MKLDLRRVVEQLHQDALRILLWQGRIRLRERLVPRLDPRRQRATLLEKVLEVVAVERQPVQLVHAAEQVGDLDQGGEAHVDAVRVRAQCRDVVVVVREAEEGCGGWVLVMATLRASSAQVAIMPEESNNTDTPRCTK